MAHIVVRHEAHKQVLSVFVIMVLLAVALTLFFYTPSPAQTKSRTPLEILKSRLIWKDLPPNFLVLLSGRLRSVENCNEFIQMCEMTGILRNNIVQLADQSDPEFSLGGVAATLTSYANALGNERKFSNAKRPLEFAVLLKPIHLPAWSSMAIVCMFLGDCKAAVYWADRVISFRPNPNSTDSWERGIAMYMTPEGQRLAAQGLGDKDMIDSWKELQEQMRLIKDTCLK